MPLKYVRNGNTYFSSTFLSASGVWDQVLHCIPHSGHAEGPLWSHEEGKVSDAGDDVWSRIGASPERKKEEWEALSPRVALALYPTCPLHAAQPSAHRHNLPCLLIYVFQLWESSFTWLILYTKDTLKRSSSKPVLASAQINPEISLAICLKSTFFSQPAPSPDSIKAGCPWVCVVSWLQWENLFKCNLYYADQGLQITAVPFWHPSCTLSVWQLALCFDSAVWRNSQHGRVSLLSASVELKSHWQNYVGT